MPDEAPTPRRRYKRNIESYATEEEILTQALESPHGLRYKPRDPTIRATRAWATKQRQRLNECRVADRQRAEEIYPQGDARHGKSQFDNLVVRTRREWNEDPSKTPWFVEVLPSAVALGQLDIEILTGPPEEGGDGET